jgi:hypothetical protein
VADFTRAVLEQLPGTTAQQNKTTVTFFLPNGRRFGMYPCKDGLYIYANRNNKTYDHTLELGADIDEAVTFVGTLPG